jgi:outer membrane protein assembly factor BamB
MYVRVTQVDPAGYLVISPVRASDKLMSGMEGSRILLEDQDAGVLLVVDEEANVGRVIRQDYLSRLIAPFFLSWTDHPEQQPEPAAKAGPTIKFRFFVGKQSWRNNPFIVGTRVFVGSSGRQRYQADELDGVYSFDLLSGERIWFVPAKNDFNDLTYIKGLVIGGGDDGEVMAVGARSGKTYWTRQFDSAVTARPVVTSGAVGIATLSGEISVLNLKDGSVKLSTQVKGAVTGGLAADRGGLWIATESGGLYRFAGYGEVQMRRNSNVYYPDSLGYTLSGSAIEWYEQLGKGRGLRAKLSAAPLVLDDSVILSLVREDAYDYPPVMAFGKDGTLKWIGTDPKRLDDGSFGNSHLTPASWYDRLILADDDSNSIYSISRETGEIVWATRLGDHNFQLWSAPVISRDYVYLATYDGFLHKFAATDGRRIWSMYLGQHERAGRVFRADEPLPDVTSDSQWQTGQSSPIYSTPAVSGDTIVVGTDEGYLYVINDQE